MSGFHFSILPLVILLLLLGAGRFLYSIHTVINDEISNAPEGKIEKVTPSDWNLPYQEVSFETSDGLSVKGWFIDNENSARAIIFAPGRGTNRWDILRNAPIEDVYESGFDILLFDPRSTGKSEGENYGFGYFESQDIIQAVKFLKEEKREESIGVWGGSAGASATIMAALETTEIDAIVADSPYASLKIAISSYGKKSKIKLTEVLFPFYMQVAKFNVTFDLSKTNLLKRVPNLRTPIFLIHGTKDQVLVPKNSRLLYENISSPKELWLVEEAGHLESYKVSPKEYEERVTSFFQKHL